MLYALWARDADWEKPETCDNCGEEDKDLTYLKNGWNFLGCRKCAETAKLVDLAEGLCDQLLSEVLAQKTLGAMQWAFEQHGKRIPCPFCQVHSKVVRFEAAVEAIVNAA